METIFDYTSVLGFIIIIGLYLFYSKKEDQNYVAYIWPSIGCAFTNYFGNKGYGEVAGVLFGLTAAYVYFFIIRTGGKADTMEP